MPRSLHVVHVESELVQRGVRVAVEWQCRGSTTADDTGGGRGDRHGRRHRVGLSDEALAMSAGQVSGVTIRGGSFSEGPNVTSHGEGIDLSHVVAGLSIRRGRSGGVGGVYLQCAIVVGVGERVGLAVVDRLVHAVVLQTVHGSGPDGAVVTGLLFPDVDGALLGLGLEEEVGRGWLLVRGAGDDEVVKLSLHPSIDSGLEYAVVDVRPSHGQVFVERSDVVELNIRLCLEMSVADTANVCQDGLHHARLASCSRIDVLEPLEVLLGILRRGQRGSRQG